jgi:pimeloyl-ACP methyl ester carboxylesterase
MSLMAVRAVTVSGRDLEPMEIPGDRRRRPRPARHPEPILVGHSDGGSIELIHAGHHPGTGLVTLAAPIFVEDVAECIR